jgi:glycosyltransferase involved in cell wall biosynthesis
MASGVPILYCGNGEGAQLVKKAEAGFVVPPENPEALAEEVLHLVNNPELARKLGLNGRSFAEAKLQWSKLVGDWLAHLDESNYVSTR